MAKQGSLQAPAKPAALGDALDLGQGPIRLQRASDNNQERCRGVQDSGLLPSISSPGSCLGQCGENPPDRSSPPCACDGNLTRKMPLRLICPFIPPPQYQCRGFSMNGMTGKFSPRLGSISHPQTPMQSACGIHQEPGYISRAMWQSWAKIRAIQSHAPNWKMITELRAEFPSPPLPSIEHGAEGLVL